MSGHHNPELVATLEAERAHKPRRTHPWSQTDYGQLERVDTAADIAERHAIAEEIFLYDPKQRAAKRRALKAQNNDSASARSTAEPQL